MKHLKLTIEDNIATVTMCNPPQNRMDLDMLADFEEAISTIRDTNNVRVAILTAEGENFSYGGYFPEWLGITGHQYRSIVERWHNVVQQWERLPFPAIAAVNGPCWGGAFEMMLACDLAYCVPEADFNHPEKTIAITTLLGGVYRFAERAGKNVAAELAFLAQPMTAQRMYELNVINKIIERDKLMETVINIAKDISRAPASVHEAHKSLLRLWSQGGMANADAALMDYNVTVFNATDTQYAFDSAEKAMKGGYPRPILDFDASSCFR